MGMKRRHIIGDETIKNRHTMGMKQSKTGTQWAWNRESFQMAIFTTHPQNVDCRHPSYCNQFVFLTRVTNITQRPKHATGLGQGICQVLESGSQTLRNEAISGTNIAQWEFSGTDSFSCHVSTIQTEAKQKQPIRTQFLVLILSVEWYTRAFDIECWMIY